MAVVRAGIVYFAMVFAAGFLLAFIRIPLLVPRFGERAAELMEMPVMFAVIFLAAGGLVRKHAARFSGAQWLAVGLVALALLIAAELVVAVVTTDRTLAEYIASRDPVSGSVYLAMLVVFAAMPWLRARRR